MNQGSTSSSSTLTRRISSTLQQRLGPHKYDMWFGHGARLHIHGDKLDVLTDSQFAADWIGSHFAPDLAGAAREALGEAGTFQVRFAPATGESQAYVNGSPAVELMPTGPIRPRRSEGRERGGLGANGRKLDDFIVGPCNRMAYAAAVRVAEEPEATAASPLFIHGECGVGKTHLLQGVCQRFLARAGRSMHVRYVTGEQFTNEYIASVRAGTIDEFRRRTRKLDLLAIDDVHFLSNKVATQGEFMHTLDAIDLSGARVVMASDEHPRQIKRFSQALVSRFLSGMVVKIDPPTPSTRRQLIRKMADARGLTLNEKAIDALASRCVGSVRELEGALTKLSALLLLTHGSEVPAVDREIGLVLMEQVLIDGCGQPRVPVKMATIIDVVCGRLGVNRDDLTGSSRHRRIVLARGLIAHLGRDLTTLSYPEIAQSLGKSFHSTVHTAAKRLGRLLTEERATEPGPDGRLISVRELTEQVRLDILRSA